MQTAIFLLLEIIIFYFCFLNICRLKYKLSESLIIIFLMDLIGASLFLNISLTDVSAVIFHIVVVILFALTAYRKNKNLPLSFLYSSISDIVYLLVSNIQGTVFDFLINPIMGARNAMLNSTPLYIIGAITLLPVVFFISRYIGNFINKKLSVIPELLQKKFSVYIIIGAVITLALFYASIFLPGIFTDKALQNTIIAVSLAVYFAYLVFAIYTYSINMVTEIRIKHKEEVLENLQAYTESVETVSTEMRKFKHDHINMLLGFGDYIAEGNMEGVKRYFDEYALAFQKTTDNYATLFSDKLKLMKIPEIKSILSSKLIYAQGLGVNVQIELSDEIEHIAFDLVDLCRAIGILLDNAIETCLVNKPAVLRFAVFKNETGIKLLIANTCPVPPPISKMYEKGYTTKENGRGLGLHSLNVILERNRNVIPSTYMDGDYFIQELLVKQ